MPVESTIPFSVVTDVRQHFLESHHAPAAPVTRELPDEYGDTKLVLLVRDPEWVFAYWEISDETRNHFHLTKGVHSKRIVVRLYRVDGRDWPNENAHYFRDIDVGQYSNNWYIQVPEAGCEWVADLGTFDDRGNFVVIVRSNLIATPRDTMSTETDSDWMVVEETFSQLYSLSGGMALRELRGSEEIWRVLEKQVLPQLKGLDLSSGALSSSGMPLIAKSASASTKDFWLQVHTELILYGATEPDAHVTVQGRHVKLNPDGTFSLRFALPDGRQVLNVHATNADGDMERTITPVVVKKTE